jgi:hypothetical protein
MIHPMRAIERKWNAHTPKFLHNGSKENIIFQLTLATLLVLGMISKDWLEKRSQKRERASWTDQEPVNLSDYAGQR